MRSTRFVSALAPILICATPMVVSSVAFSAVAQSQSLSAASFVQKASIANKFEIDSSKLALDHSQRDDVKAFAQRMIDDHTKTGEKLQQTLSDENSSITPADSLDKKHQHLMDALNNAGDHFDTLYIQDQTAAHKEAVGLFSNYAANGKDAGLKQFASDTLPDLKKHLHHVQTLSNAQ